jgi:hypothetical protein
VNSVTLAKAVLKYRPHRGLAAASLIDKLAEATPGADPWTLDLNREEREMLGHALAEHSDPPTSVEVERAVAALISTGLRAHERVLTEKIAQAEASGDREAIADLLVLKQMVKRALDGLEE